MQKILLLRFSSIGDIVLTTPIIRAIKEQKPKVELHFATKKAYAAVLEHHPHIDKLILLEESMTKLVRVLKKENYDYIVDLHRNLRTQRIKWALRKPYTTFDKLNREKWLMVKFKKNHLPDVHIVDRYFKALEKLGISNDFKGLDYYNGCENQLSQELEELVPDKFVALVLGGTYYTKQIPEEKLNELLEHLKLPAVLLGGPGEQDLAKKLSSRFPQNTRNAVGKSNLNQSAEIIRKSNFVITGDTGLMHIAAAYEKSIFSIWGNTIPDFGMTPYLPQTPQKSHILQVENLSCRPCSKLGFHSCPKKHFDCMMKQDFSEIYKAISE